MNKYSQRLDFKILASLLFILLIIGCTRVQNISDIKTEENIDTQVMVKGIVSSSIKLGDLSGYTIADDTGSIFVSSDSLPADDSEVIATGILKRTILGYYIETKEQ